VAAKWWVALGLVIAALVVLSVRDYYSPVYQNACSRPPQPGEIVRGTRYLPAPSIGPHVFVRCTPYSSFP
jgi:hypothetical protein